MRLEIPNPSLVLLIGVAGSGKSSFARKHFAESQIVSSDHLRAVVCDDEQDQSATRDAFELLHLIVAKRLRRRKLTVVDATNVQERARRPLLTLARSYQIPCVAIVFRLPQETCVARNRERPNRSLAADIIRKQFTDLEETMENLWLEGFHSTFVLSSVEEVEEAEIILVEGALQPGGGAGGRVST